MQLVAARAHGSLAASPGTMRIINQLLLYWNQGLQLRLHDKRRELWASHEGLQKMSADALQFQQQGSAAKAR